MNNCLIRSSSKNINGENFLSQKRNASSCKIDYYRNDQYASRTSVSSSVRTGRYAYSNIINNSNNSKVFKSIAYIEISNNTIYEYMPSNSIIGYLSVNNSNSYYQYYTHSNKFYIQNNILYSKESFEYNKDVSIDVVIQAKVCSNSFKNCDILTKKFCIEIISSLYIQRVLSLCDIDYQMNTNLLSYLNDEQTKKIYILKNIEWYNYYNDQIIPKDYIRDNSYIEDQEQLYKIIIITYYYDENNNVAKLENIFEKTILNNVVIVGDQKEGSTLEITFDEEKNKYQRFTKYFWWSVDNNNNKSIINKENTKYYTLSSLDVDKQIIGGVIFRNDITIVIRNISPPTEKIENINNEANGIVSIIGNPNVGKTFTINENVSDVDGITNKIITWYQSQLVSGNAKTVIYEWQISSNIQEAQDWSTINYSNYNNYTIPDDPSYIGYAIRIKADLYDVYGNLSTIYSPVSKPIEDNNNLPTKQYDFELTGSSVLGETLTVNQVNTSITYNTIKYVWKRSVSKTSWSIIPNNINNNSFVIPSDQGSSYVNNYIKCYITTTDTNNKTHYYETNSSEQISNYPFFTDGSLILNGNPVEGNRMTALFTLNDGLDINDYTIEYIWEVSNNKRYWVTMSTGANYSLQQTTNSVDYTNTSSSDDVNIVSTDNKSLLIPMNGSFLNMYLKCQILIIDNNTNDHYALYSNITLPIKNKDVPATGTLSLEGNPTFGEKITAKFSNLNDTDGYISVISYLWQYAYASGQPFINIDDYNNSYYDIPYDLFADGTIIRVVATTVDVLGGKTNFTSNNLTIQSKTQDENSKIVISGKIIEGSTLNVVIVDDNLNSQSLSYQWEYSYDQSDWNLINYNSNTVIIPDNGTFIDKYLRASVSYIDENDNVVEYYSPSTTQVQYLKQQIDGTLTLLGVPMIGQKLRASLQGLFNDDSILLNDDDTPYRESELELTTQQVGFKYKVSISYIDNYGYPGIVYSNYSPIVTDQNNLFLRIPKQPCSFFTETTQYDFLNALDECDNVVIGIGGVVTISDMSKDKFTLKGGQQITLDGGTLNVVNCNMEIENDAIFIIQNKGEFNLNGNLVTNERSQIIYEEDIYSSVSDLVDFGDNQLCYISYNASLSILNSLLNECDKVYLTTNGVVTINENFSLPENKTIVIESNAQLNILNANLTLLENSKIIVYGYFNISGSIEVENNGEILVDKTGVFNSYSVIPSNRIYINVEINISQLMEYFKTNFEVVIGNGGILSDFENVLTLNENQSLIIDKDGSLSFEQCDIIINNGALLSIYGSFNINNGTLFNELNSYLFIDENSSFNI